MYSFECSDFILFFDRRALIFGHVDMRHNIP
jgi:hypothetical protein